MFHSPLEQAKSKSWSFHQVPELQRKEGGLTQLPTVEVAQPGRQGASLLLVWEREVPKESRHTASLHHCYVAALTQNQAEFHIALGSFSLITGVTDAVSNCDPR